MILFYRINGLRRYGKRSVFDEFENERYIVEQTITPLKSIFSNAERIHTVSIKDMAGGEVVRLVRSFKNVICFDIFVGDEKITSAWADMDDFNPHYDYPSLDWKMTFDLLKFQYTITKGETQIATVRYAGGFGRASLKIDIPDPANAEMVLAAVVAMYILGANEPRASHSHYY